MENENLLLKGQTESSSQEQEIKQKGYSLPLIGIFIIIVIALVGGAYYLGTKNSQSLSQQKSVDNKSTVDLTPKWDTYTSTRAPYSFKYPKQQWPITDITSSGHGFVEALAFSPAYNSRSSDTSLGALFVFKDNKVSSIDDYVNQHVKTDSSKVNLQYTTIGGEKAVSYTLSGGIPPLPIIQYTVYKNGYYYEIWIDNSIEVNKNRQENINIFNQILSTFKFSDQTTNWKMFSNEAYSFKYPSEWYIENPSNPSGLSFFKNGVTPIHSTSGRLGNEKLITIDYSVANFDNMKNNTKTSDNSPVFTETIIAGKRILKSTQLESADIQVKHLDDGNDRILNLRVTDAKDIPTLDQILSTLKFN